jgi:hypothetical protein
MRGEAPGAMAPQQVFRSAREGNAVRLCADQAGARGFRQQVVQGARMVDRRAGRRQRLGPFDGIRAFAVRATRQLQKQRQLVRGVGGGGVGCGSPHLIALHGDCD